MKMIVVAIDLSSGYNSRRAFSMKLTSFLQEKMYRDYSWGCELIDKYIKHFLPHENFHTGHFSIVPMDDYPYSV